MQLFKHRLFLFLIFSFPLYLVAQDSFSEELDFEVNKVYPPLSIAKDTLIAAQTLSDLNRYYKSSWIKEYISVKILAIHQEKIVQAVNKSGLLSEAQKDIMKNADVGTAISVEVRYIPDNTLSHNDVKAIDFTFTIDPEKNAQYTGGQAQLISDIKASTQGKICLTPFHENQYHMAAVKFTISEEGQVINAHVFQTSKEKKTDESLLAAICNLQDWKPAEYANGTKVKQDFVLTVGNPESCIIHLLNVRRDSTRHADTNYRYYKEPPPLHRFPNCR